MDYIGIDPGKNGGIAVVGFGSVEAYKLTESKLINILKTARDKNNILQQDYSICYLEQVHSMPNQGVSSTFSFGENFGFIKGVLEAYGITCKLVTPQKWKKAMGCTSDKQTSIRRCKELFPTVDLRATKKCRTDHDGMAEALLIAEYGRRVENDYMFEQEEKENE